MKLDFDARIHDIPYRLFINMPARGVVVRLKNNKLQQTIFMHYIQNYKNCKSYQKYSIFYILWGIFFLTFNDGQ